MIHRGLGLAVLRRGRSSGVGSSVALKADQVVRFNYGAGSATAEWRLAASGLVQSFYGQEEDYYWLLAGNSADYEVRATGSGVNGTLGSWMGLESDRSWTVSSTSGTVTGSMTVEIRRKGSATVLASAAISFHAESGGGLL